MGQIEYFRRVQHNEWLETGRLNVPFVVRPRMYWNDRLFDWNIENRGIVSHVYKSIEARGWILVNVGNKKYLVVGRGASLNLEWEYLYFENAEKFNLDAVIANPNNIRIQSVKRVKIPKP